MANFFAVPELSDRKNGTSRSNSNRRISPEFIPKGKGWKKLKGQLPKLKGLQNNSAQFGSMRSSGCDFDLITPPKFQQNSNFAMQNTGEEKESTSKFFGQAFDFGESRKASGDGK